LDGVLEKKHEPSVQEIRARMRHAELPQKYLTHTEKVCLRRVFGHLDLEHDGRLDAVELREAMRLEGILIGASEAEQMIWEVDESGRGSLSITEFANAYIRAKNDAEAKEPRRLYNYITYKMMDKNSDGDITSDEVFSYVYPQMSKAEVEQLMIKMFGDVVPDDRSINAMNYVRIMQSRLWSRDASAISDQRHNRPPITVPERQKTIHEKNEEARKIVEAAIAREQTGLHTEKEQTLKLLRKAPGQLPTRGALLLRSRSSPTLRRKRRPQGPVAAPSTAALQG